jgi:hypothetical protein
MSKRLFIVDHPAAELPNSFLALEDDDVLAPLWELTSSTKPMMAWALFEDLYGEALFTPETAQQLARECEELASEAEPTINVWLLTIAAFAAAASEQKKHVIAIPD